MHALILLLPFPYKRIEVKRAYVFLQGSSMGKAKNRRADSRSSRERRLSSCVLVLQCLSLWNQSTRLRAIPMKMGISS
jgi:hypothetical protein